MEFQRTSSFLGLEAEPDPEAGPGAGPELGVGPSLLLPVLWAAAAAAREDWWEGLPIMVMEKGSSGDSKMGTPLSLSFWDDDEEEEADGAFLSPWEAKGSPPRPSGPPLCGSLSPRPSRESRGRAGAQGSGEAAGGSGGAVLSKAARKGSSGGMCLQLHTGASSSGGARPRPNAGKVKKEGSMSGAGRGERGALAHTPAGSSCAGGVRPGEGSRKAVRKGSGARVRPLGSLPCAVDGQAAQPVGSGEGPRG